MARSKNEKGPLADLFLCPWMDCIPQGARKAVRLCPWMYGQIFAPRQLLLHCPTTVHPWTYAISALPPSVVVVCRGAMDGRERRMYRMYWLKIAPAFSALPMSVWVVFRKERRMSMDGGSAIGLKQSGGRCNVFVNS